MDAAPLILVVGMHRSGTSLLSGLLHGLGFSSSGPLIAADHNNPEGYFERADITAIQERLLTDLGRWWPTATALLPLPPSWLIEPCTERAHHELLELLQAEPAQTPIAIKDPRSSRLLPLWRRIASELARPLRLILAVRDPEEVITSLVNRDGPVTGMTVERAAALWCQHNEEVLLHSVGLPLLLVDYSRWFEPTAAARQIQAIANFCDLSPLPSNQQAVLLKQIRPEHRRSIPQLPLAPDACSALYQHLKQGVHIPLQPAPVHQDRPRTATHRDIQTHPWGAVAMHDCGGQERQARQLLKRWVQEGLSAERAGPELLESWFDASFYIAANSDLLASLAAEDRPALLRHYLQHGWMEGRQPHPYFDPRHYLQQLCQRGIPLPADRSPLEHFLQLGRHIGVVPSPSISASTELTSPPDLNGLHPWAGVARALADHNSHGTAALLAQWIAHGKPPEAVIQLAASETGHNLRWPTAAAPEGRNASQPLDLSPWPQHIHASWEAIGWLAALDEPFGAIQLCLSPPDPDTTARWLRQGPGSGVEIVETDPPRHRLWQRFGLRSRLITKPDRKQLERWLPAEPWLARAEQWLGLPHPEALSHHQWLCFGPGGPFWDEQANLELAYVPGLNDLDLGNLDQARALACWLWQCHRQGLELVEFRSSPREPASCWLPIVTLNPFGLDQQSLLALLEQQRSHNPVNPQLPTPQPHSSIAFNHNTTEQAAVAVVVSLHNYADRILEGLESVRTQTLNPLELIVVDDASSDDGPARVQAWMQREHQRFSRCLLVQHTNNGGLASARNTGFQLASAAWCFVLDADNTLRPTCLERCWQISQQGSTALAVVHPLIQRRNTAGISDGLISGRSWQRESFLAGNHIDAMALVKREAWAHVGGYTHIPHGWEDYDFWCKLIEADFHGVLCPEVLATYRIHAQSMVHQSSHRDTQSLSRILQLRHPWLELPLGSSGL